MNFKYIEIGATGKFTYLNLEDINVMIGSLFSEIDLLNIANVFNKTILDNGNKTNNPFYNLDKFIKDIIFTEFELIFEKVNLVVITNIDEILSWPLILRKLNSNLMKKKLINENNQLNKQIEELNLFKRIKFITTEPITQISRTLLCDFYDYFNKIMNENVNDYQYFVNSIFINEFLDSIINLNYNCEFKLEDHLQIVMGSSGYNLGSSNVLFKFYNKKIIYLSKSAFFDYRYPKAFDYFEEIKELENTKNIGINKKKDINDFSNFNILEPDVLICANNIIKFEEEFIPEFEKIINLINNMMQQYDRQNNHFPSIFFPNDPLFILDFIDIKRLKISNDIRCIYLSKVIKAILEYANVSHGFINNVYHNKIYDFKLPFDYEEMIKNDSFSYFEDFEEFIKSINRSETETSYSFPKILMLNLYMLISNGLGSELYDFFIMNSSMFDGFFNLNKNSLGLETINNPSNQKSYNLKNSNLISLKNEKEFANSNLSSPKFRYLPFNFDYNMNILNFSDIIFNKWKPKLIYFNKSILHKESFVNSSQKEKYEKDIIPFTNWLNDNFNQLDRNVNINELINNKRKTSTTSSENIDINNKLNSIIDVHISNSKIFSNDEFPLTFEHKKCNLNQSTNKIEFSPKSSSIFLKIINPEILSKKDDENNNMETEDFNNSSLNDKNLETINFENLNSENAFLINKKDNIYDKLTKDFITNNKSQLDNDKLQETVVQVKIEKENEKLYFQPVNEKINFEQKLCNNPKSDKDKQSFDFENFINYLKEYLKLNNMKITEITDGEMINIYIVREVIIDLNEKEKNNTQNEEKTYSSIVITKKDDNKYDFNLISDNIDDSYFLNYILHN